MPSYAVTGATRGIGFGWIEKLSSDAKNQVFALIRSRETAAPLEKLAAERSNVHIIVTDISSPKKLDQAAAEIAQVTGGSLDVLILNAGSATPETRTLPPSAFYGRDEELEIEINENVKANLISNIYVINCFLSLIRKGVEKKIIYISSPSGDVDFNRITGIAGVVGYGAAKAGMNLVISKYHAELAPEGIKTLSMSPGWVATDAAQAITGDPDVRRFMLSAFHKIDSRVQGPIPVEESVTSQLRVIQNLTEADSGKHVGRLGDNDWF